jgi:hypothetical protein
MDIKITKILDKLENLDVKGCGCLDDCFVAGYVGQTAGKAGCKESVVYTAQTTSWW